MSIVVAVPILKHARRYGLIANVAAPQWRSRQVSARFLSELVEVRVRRGDVKLRCEGEGVLRRRQVGVLTEHAEAPGAAGVDFLITA